MSSHDCPQSAPTTLIVGRVIDESTSRPLPGLTVVAREGVETAAVLRRAHTDADGRFELCLSAEDLRTLLLRGSEAPMLEAYVYLGIWNGTEYIDVQSPILQAGPLPSQLDVGDLEVTVPTNTRTYTLRAVVVSAAAVALPGITVELESVTIGARTRLAMGTTDADGKAVLSYAGGTRASAADTDLRLRRTRSASGRCARTRSRASARGSTFARGGCVGVC